MLKKALRFWLKDEDVTDVVPYKEINKQEVKRLTQVTEQLAINSQLVGQKYEELKTTEKKLSLIIDKFKKEDFTKEIGEIKSLTALTDEEKEGFSQSFDRIRSSTVAQLEPIVHTIQRVQAHMLVTLHKAMHKNKLA